MAEIHAQRLARLREAMAAANIPALYTTHPYNRRYLTGYTAEDHLPNESAGAVLVLPDAAYLHVGRLNATQAQAEAPEYTVVDYFKRSDIVDQMKTMAAGPAQITTSALRETLSSMPRTRCLWMPCPVSHSNQSARSSQSCVP